MSDSITIIWTPVPSGLRPDGTAVLSVLVSPRLQTSDGLPTTLSNFPPFVDWPATLRTLNAGVSFGGGAESSVTLADPGAASSDLWQALFPADGTAVRSYESEDFSDHTLISYASVQARNALRDVYATQAATSAVELPGVRPFFADLNETHFRLTEAVAHAKQFHAKLPPAGDAPTSEDQLAGLLDFHEMLSSLGDHVPVLRRIGLLFDVLLSDPPAPSDVPTTVALVPHFRASDVCPAVQAELNVTGFFALPHESNVQLNLRDGGHDLVEIDVDGALLKFDSMQTALTHGLAAPDAPSTVTLPALRSGGLAITLNGRATTLAQNLTTFAGYEMQLAAGGAPPILDSSQLVRGYVLDVDDGRGWSSLCRRHGVYHFTRAPQLDFKLEDVEGSVQLAVTAHPAQNGNAPALKLHESLARWDGWSLAAPRPGKSMSHDSDPESPPESPTNDPHTSAGVAVQWEVQPGTLPTLRFGRGYRVRARTVDLVGNVIGLEEADESQALPAGGPFTYRRFEPVAAPITVLRAALEPDANAGESSDRLVVRTPNADPSLDSAPGTPGGDRHLAPPRASVQLAETHGALDDPSGKPRADLYQMLRDRDGAALGSTGNVTLEPAERLLVPYLPDPIARGVVLRDLPGTAGGTVGRPDANGRLIYEPLAGEVVRPGSATIIPFGFDDGWPDAVCLRLAVADGDGPPDWDPDARVLTVRLAKGTLARVPLSSLLDADDLELMGIWGWLRQWLDDLQTSDPTALLAIADQVTKAIQLSLEGGHWMLTPPRGLVLVSAVQQPIGEPAFSTFVADRGSNSTLSGFIGELRIHSTSTSRIELLAEWTEPTDDESQSTPGRAGPLTAVVDELVLTEPVSAGSTTVLTTRGHAVGTWHADENRIVFDPDAGEPRHEFHDHRHRVVRYSARAATRFREYFPPDQTADFTRTSAPIEVDVPASARPAAPNVLYALPTFGWERQEATNLRVSRRLGGGLRIYLARPWFSSGEEERLAVVVFPDNLTDELRATIGSYVTQWGRDPVVTPIAIGPEPGADAFPRAKEVAKGVPLSELGAENAASAGVDVAAHDVEFVPDRNAWSCDIELSPGASYRPFVRLALARYQAHALPTAKLSPVVLLDWAQLAPDRTVIATRDPAVPARIHVTVSGPTFPNARPPDAGTRIEIGLLERYSPLPDEIGWRELPLPAVTQTQSGTRSSLLWRGIVDLPSGLGRGPFRLLVRELEDWPSDAGPGQREAYFDVLALPSVEQPPAAPPPEAGLEFVDWSTVASGSATGRLTDQSVTLSGPIEPGPGNYLNGGFTEFNSAAFSPPLAASDAVYLVGSPEHRYTLMFSSAVSNPVFYLASLGSTITFVEPGGVELTRISGDERFDVAGASVSGEAIGSTDANGVVLVTGIFTMLTFSVFYDGGGPDGIYLQVGVQGSA